MNWSNEWKVDLDGPVSDVELILIDDERHEYKVKAIIVGDLAVHSDRAGWSYTVTHVPTMTMFRLAVPLGDHSKQSLIEWCGEVQLELKDDWAALRTLTPDNYHDLSEVRQRIRDWCLSVKVK